MRPEQIEQLISDLEYIGLDSEEITYFIAAATSGLLRQGLSPACVHQLPELSGSSEPMQHGWNIAKGSFSVH